jgi:hypothetical protein
VLFLRNEKAKPANFSSLATLRDSSREQVSNYFASFSKVDGELGVSIEQALEQLSRLAASRKPPLNEARIDADQLGRHRDLTFALTLLRQASKNLGSLKLVLKTRVGLGQNLKTLKRFLLGLH